MESKTRVARCAIYLGVLGAVLFLVTVLWAVAARAQPTAYLDWSNQVARPVGESPESPDHAYTVEEFEAAKGNDLYLFTAQALFTDTGWQNAQDIAQGAPILAYVTVLHASAPELYDGNPWPWIEAVGSVHSGTHAFSVNGEPAIRWKAQQPKRNGLHQDARLADPVEYVQLIAEWVERYPVQGLFLDYLAENPWTYPGDPALDHSALGGMLLWRSYQGILVYELRRHFGPDFLLIGNGRWSMDEPGWQSHVMLSGVFWERSGTLWWTIPQTVGRVDAHHGGLHLFDGRRAGKSGSWDMDQAAQLLALTTPGGYLVVGPGLAVPR